MSTPGRLADIIFDNSISFEERCLEIFEFQFDHNPVYRTFAKTLGSTPGSVFSVHEIPLIPIQAFKRVRMITELPDSEPEIFFESSGTGGMERSRHYILKESLYRESVLRGFQQYFSFDSYALAFYLPGYLENRHSSLIRMAEILKKSDNSGLSRFIESVQELTRMQSEISVEGKKVLLFGAAFGLLDFIDEGEIPNIDQMEIIETGGMKTHRREMTKQDLRSRLSDGFRLDEDAIHSEYGMCELLSQMYAMGSEWFTNPHWTEVTIRNPDDPMHRVDSGLEGKIGIIDLANAYSCPFILTEDRGIMNPTEEFRVLGRWNPESLRGCNFLIDDE